MTKQFSQESKQAAAKPAQKRDTTLELLLSMADTTWRMFVPPAILVPVGIFADMKFQTKPWITIVSAVLGLGLSVILVKRQLAEGKE